MANSPERKDPVLEGEILPPGGNAKAEWRETRAEFRVWRPGLLARILMGLAALAVSALVLLLAASLALFLLPVVAVLALIGWWRIKGRHLFRR